jgi:hypothetical protein
MLIEKIRFSSRQPEKADNSQIMKLQDNETSYRKSTIVEGK